VTQQQPPRIPQQYPLPLRNSATITLLSFLFFYYMPIAFSVYPRRCVSYSFFRYDATCLCFTAVSVALLFFSLPVGPFFSIHFAFCRYFLWLLRSHAPELLLPQASPVFLPAMAFKQNKLYSKKTIF
jgi:hypothetical protein